MASGQQMLIELKTSGIRGIDTSQELFGSTFNNAMYEL